MAERAVAVIQARMGSTRLPGKVLLPLAGQPVLWHIVERLRRCRNLDAIVIATSDQPGDDDLVSFAAALGIPLVRGPEEDVLERFCLAAATQDADIVLRVTGDAPLVDPELIDAMIALLRRTGADYCTGEPGVAAIHEGFAPFTRAALERLKREAGTDPVAREHVDSYIKLHPETFRICYVPIPEAHRIQGARVSVDTPADLAFLEALYRETGASPGEIDVAAAVALLRRHPELMATNAHVRQKTTTETSFRLVIRCDGYPEIGLGHVVRCLALARQLRDAHGVGVRFALLNLEPGPSLVREAGFPFDLWDGCVDEGAWLGNLLDKTQTDALLLDVRTDLELQQVASWRSNGLLVAVLDDPSDRRLMADLAFYPPVPQLREMDWTDFQGGLCAGWDWLPLRPGFDRKLPEPHNMDPHVVVTMGGSDPAALSLRVLRALEGIDGLLRVRLILGRGFAHRAALETLRPTLRQPLEILEDVNDMPAALADADLAVAAFGVTAYELAALGVPAVLLGLSADHAHSAEALHQAGMAWSLGEHAALSDTDLTAAIQSLLANPAARSAMRAACTLVDGRGAQRIAARMAKALADRSVGINASKERTTR